MKYIIALDAGTTSIRAFCYDLAAKRFVHRAQQEVESRFPHPGWVEQDAAEIYFKAAYVVNDCVRAVGAENVAGIGVTNQRETVVAFDAETGEPVCPAIVWQCRRTSAACAALPEEIKRKIKARTGLFADAYFSAPKMRWILENEPAAAALARKGRLRFGTVDAYLIYRFTGNFVTDHTNASRTMLFDLETLQWDGELCRFFGIEEEFLPRPLPSDAVMGTVKLLSREIPIAGAMGDQQAALLGQACLNAGDGKATYGTGLFLLLPTGSRPVFADGLLTTVGGTYAGRTLYALEGSVFHAGSGIQWLRDELGFLENAAESERLARSVADTGGVFFVPAFTGLGAPYWNSEARALLSGITRGTRREHIVRAVLESIAYSARDLAECMAERGGARLTALKCDGGACANDFLMQFQADVLGIAVDRPAERESTALGAAYLCALALGLTDPAEIGRSRVRERLFEPSENREYYDGLYAQYRRAVARAVKE